MIVEIISVISLGWGAIKHFNDDYFYQLDTDK